MTPLRMNQVLRGALVAIIVATIGVLYVGNQRMVTVAHDTAKLRAQVRANADQITAYTRTQVKVESLDYVDELANKVLPAEKEQSAIIAEVSEFALRSSLPIEQITFVETSQSTGKAAKGKLAIPKGVEVIPVTIQFQTGSRYTDVLDFLRTVESNRRKMQVTDISITPDADDRTILSQVSVSMNLYAKQEKKQDTK